MTAGVKLRPRDAKDLRTYLSGRATAHGDDEAARFLTLLGPRRAHPKKDLHLPGPDKEQERRDRLDRLAKIRVALHAETAGRCAVCGQPVQFALMHAHHILSGPERQAEERQETMAPTHDRCHDWLHGKDRKWDQREALVALLEWCLATGRVAAASSTTKRIAKLDEARAAGRTT